MFFRVCPDSQEAQESLQNQEVRSDNISKHQSCVWCHHGPLQVEGSMTSLTPDELSMTMSDRQHDSGEGDDKEQRMKRWKRKREEFCQEGVETGGQEVLRDWTAPVRQVDTLRCQRSNKDRRGGFLQVGERRRSAPERRMKVR